MKEKVLLVGGAGYIGGLTCDYLINDGFDVTVYDNLLYENRYLKDVPFIYGDIRDTEKLNIVSENFNIIVIMSALVGDPACSVDPFLTEEINYTAIKNFCNVVSPDKHLIFMSTCSVYGAQDGILNEESDTNPLSSYASTKLMAEKHILEKNGTIFRLGTVFGLGDTYSRIRMDLVVNVLTMKAVKEGVININGGEQWRPIIAVRDIAGYVTEACREKYNGIYVLAKENVIIRELGERVANMIPNTKINYTEISFQDARNYKVKNEKILSTGWTPLFNIEDGIKEINFILKNSRIKNPLDIIYHNANFLKHQYENPGN
jgi:nucleoside-diphosphate-sugar epimerase